jgi:PAS domain-containing protein
MNSSDTEQRLREIVDSIPGLVVLLTAEGQVEFVNRKGLEYFGKTLEELKSWETADVVPHDVIEYWDGGSLKVFHDIVTMKFDDPTQKIVKPLMTHFFYMDKADPSKVSRWVGSAGPTGF